MRESKWNFYVNSLQGHPSIAYTNKADPNTLKEMIHLFDTKGLVLCVGCADGSEVKAFENAGFEAKGITVGSNNVEYGKKEFGVDLIEMDFHDLTFSPCSFDYAYSSHSFEHAFAPWVHILEVWTVLKPKGRWYLKHPFYSLSEAEGGAHSPSYHHPNVQEISYQEKVFYECGFDILMAERVGTENRFLLQKNDLSKVHSAIKECLQKRRGIK